MFLKNYWYVAASPEEVGGKPIGRVLLGEPVVMYRTSKGVPVAFEDRCCHRNAPLSRGHVVGDNLQCGYHGLTFNSKGDCISVPGQTKTPPGAGVKSYPVVERWGWVWIWMGDATKADPAEIPSLYWHDDPEWTRQVAGYLHIEGNYQLLIDNLLDLTHLTFLHGSTIGNEHVANTPLAKVTRNSRKELRSTALELVSRDLPCANAIRWMYNIDPPPLYARSGGFTKPDDRVDRWQIIRFEPPSHVWLDVGLARAGTGAPDGDRSQGATHTVVNGITPESESSTHYFWTFPRNHSLRDVDLNEYLQKGIISTFMEDKDMIEGQQKIINTNAFAPKIEINADAAAIIARNIIDELLQEQKLSSIAQEAAE
tara:strand:+ start:229 stop:1335 length:1107 start_codon:yes stop_codon:yes gene_type:complete